MGDQISADTSDLDQLVKSLVRIDAATLPAVDAVVARGALNVKTGAAQRAAHIAHAPAYPRSITYDTFHTPRTSQAVIGPDKDKRQGALGNILEYGTVNNPPVPHLQPALDEEAPRFVKALADVAAALLERA
jgi:hypothetical protein